MGLAHGLCASLAKSSLIPTQFKDKPADLAIAISMGNEVGLHWTHAIQSMAVINGRPSLWGDGALAVVMAHKDFEWIDENESDDTKGVTIIKRRGMPPRRYEFTLEMARGAGLLTKDTYKQHQARMLQRRSRARCMADTFPDALKGIGLADDYQPQPEKVIEAEVVQPKAREVQERMAKRRAPKADPDPQTGEIVEAQPAAGPSEDDIIKLLTEAKDADELKIAADLARSIKTDEKKTEASNAYKTSLARLKSA